MNPSLLREAGESLYGVRWQSDLARDLNVADRTVRRWLDGSYPVPDGIWAELKNLLHDRRDALASVLRKLPR